MYASIPSTMCLFSVCSCSVCLYLLPFLFFLCVCFLYIIQFCSLTLLVSVSPLVLSLSPLVLSQFPLVLSLSPLVLSPFTVPFFLSPLPLFSLPFSLSSHHTWGVYDSVQLMDIDDNGKLDAMATLKNGSSTYEVRLYHNLDFSESSHPLLVHSYIFMHSCTHAHIHTHTHTYTHTHTHTHTHIHAHIHTHTHTHTHTHAHTHSFPILGDVKKFIKSQTRPLLLE